MKRDGASTALWQATTEFTNTSVIPEVHDYDVVIVGAGITDITTALLLQKTGLRVLIAEAHSPGFGTTGGTTSHLNSFMDTSYDIIANDFGKEHAYAVADVVAEAFALIKSKVKNYNTDCQYTDLPGYIYAQDEKQDEKLEKVLKATLEAGMKVESCYKIPIPLPFTSVLKFSGQATFHPLRYITGVLKEFQAQFIWTFKRAI